MAEKLDIMCETILLAAGFDSDGLDAGERKVALGRMGALRQAFYQFVKAFSEVGLRARQYPPRRG